MAVMEKPDVKSAGQEAIPVKNPVTGATIGSIPVMTRAEVEAAAERARAAQPAWAARSVKERAKLLLDWADALVADQEKAISIIRSETGKNRMGAWEEVFVMNSTCLYYYHRAPGILRPQTRRPLVIGKQKARVYYKPHGVCGFITPWNFPMLNALQDLVPALIAGNTVLHKPSEVTPYTSIYAVELMHKVGIPKDVIQVITGAGTTGAAMVDVVDYVAFTGSTATGRKIAMRCAERLIPCSLELGGKDPLIVLKDANLDLAASGTVVGGLDNAGQICISTERVYVEEAVYDQYVEKLKHYVEQMNIGTGDGMFDVHMGSMTNERELLKVEDQVAEAVQKGAKLVTGGKRRPDIGPLFYEPTVLTDVNHDMKVMREETFGPVIPVMRVKDENEAIRLANDNEYGLSGAIYTKDLKRGEALATQIQSGDMHINCTQWIFGMPSLPMGGVKNSGLGRRNGPEGLLRFVKSQSLVIDNNLMDKPRLTQLDPFGMRVALLLLKLRRLLPGLLI